MRCRTLTLLATPAVLGALTVAVPALAGISLDPAAHTATSKCFIVRVGKHRVRECLIRGPRGPRGVPGPAGPRGFTGATGKTGKTGLTGKTGATGSQGVQGIQGPPGTAGTARAYAVVNPLEVETTPSAKGLVAAQSHNILAISDTAANSGVYCLVPASGIDPTADAAVVSPEVGYGGETPGVVALNAKAPNCHGDFEVDTYAAIGSKSPTGGYAFTILVP